MQCHEIQTQLAAYANGDLDSAQSEIIQAHIEQCPECKAELIKHQKTWEALDLIEPPQVSDNFTSKLMDRLACEQTAHKPGRSRVKRYGWKVAVAVAASFLLVTILNHNDPNVDPVTPDPPENYNPKIISNLDLYQNRDLLENLDFYLVLDTLVKIDEAEL